MPTKLPRGCAFAEREVEVGRLLVKFATDWARKYRRRAMLMHPELLRAEVREIIIAAGGSVDDEETG